MGVWDQIHKAQPWKHTQKVRQQTQSSEEQPIFRTSLNHDDACVFRSDYKVILPRLRFGLKYQKPSWFLPGSKIFNALTSCGLRAQPYPNRKNQIVGIGVSKCIPRCRCLGKQLRCSYHEANFGQLCR